MGYMSFEYPDFYVKGTPPCQKVEDPDIFFPDPYGLGSGEVSRKAKAVCNSGCPYKDACLAWALSNNEPGVWGGKSENERRKMKRDTLKSAQRGSLYS